MERFADKVCKVISLIGVIATLMLFIAASPHAISSYYFKSNTLVGINSSSLSLLYNYEPEFKTQADSIIIPFKRAGHLLLIEATIDGQIGNLVFDTGANGLVLNSTYFRDYVRIGSAISNGITGSVGNVEQISVERMEFGELSYSKITADVTNLGHIENRRGMKILGLMGFCMMKNLEIVIDIKNGYLKLFKLDKKGQRLLSKSGDHQMDYVQKIEGISNVVFLKGKIAGKLLNFCLDTGAETNAISSDASKSILNTLTITRRMELKGSGAVKSEVLFGRMNDFTMGNKQIRDMETIITNLDALSEAYGSHIDGMLGYSFLEHGIVVVNFVKKQFGIHFMKGQEK